jgi:hypothetical protein
VWQNTLREAGLQIRFLDRVSEETTDCDVLLIDSKFYRDRWAGEMGAVLAEFARMAEKCRLVYCDTTDSSGSLQSELMPIVHVYGKAQVLSDRSQYMRPIYGNRLYGDYYHRRFGIEDAVPEWSVPVQREVELSKIRVSWNSGLADYSLTGPARMALYARMPLSRLLRFPDRSAGPRDRRSQDVSSRFGESYGRESVAFQRQEIRRRAANRFDTRKLSRRQYFRELRSSKVVVSPFGYGEITLKDFEVFLTGGLLIKPDMTHMQTWPDVFRAGETMLSHEWDLSNFDDVVLHATREHRALLPLAEAGQREYLSHLRGPDASAKFVRQLRALIH